MWFYYRRCTYNKLPMFAGQLRPNEEICAQLHNMICFLALICAASGLAYPVVANVLVLHLAFHQDLLYYRAEDSDVAEATL